jgi:hypothetical protein
VYRSLRLKLTYSAATQTVPPLLILAQRGPLRRNEGTRVGIIAQSPMTMYGKDVVDWTDIEVTGRSAFPPARMQ